MQSEEQAEVGGSGRLWAAPPRIVDVAAFRVSSTLVVMDTGMRVIWNVCNV